MGKTEVELGDVSLYWSWTDQQTYAMLLYAVAFFFAVWKQIQRSRLEYEVSLQVKQLDQPMNRSLLWCCRLISFCFLLRVGWFFLRVSQIVANNDNNPDKDCISGWDCRGDVLTRALSRLASFMHIMAFSLIVLYWVRWKNAVHKKKVGANALDDGDNAGGKRKLNLWEAGFILIDCWLFAFQAVILALSLVLSLGSTGKRINKGYQYAVAVVYLFLAFSMTWNGIEILNLVRSQHTYIKDILVQKRMARAKVKQMSKMQKQLQNFRKERNRQKKGEKTESPHPRPKKEGNLELSKKNNSVLVGSVNGESKEDIKGSKNRNKVFANGQNLPISAEHTVNSTKAVDDQVSKGIYKIVLICGLCVPIFLMLVVIYLWRPATGSRLDDAQVVYPWFMFVFPEIISSVAVLVLISPTSEGLFQRCRRCQCWEEIFQWIKWTARDCLFCCTCCGLCGLLENKIYQTATGLAETDGRMEEYKVEDIKALRADISARGIPSRFYEMSPDELNKIYQFDEDVNVSLDPLSRYPTYDAQRIPITVGDSSSNDMMANEQSPWPGSRQIPLLQEDLEMMKQPNRKNSTRPAASSAAAGAGASAVEGSTLPDDDDDWNV